MEGTDDLLSLLSSKAPARAVLTFCLCSGSSVTMATVDLREPRLSPDPRAMLPWRDLWNEPRLESPGLREPLLESDLIPSSPLLTENNFAVRLASYRE